jgi:ankyrin repeat protein
VRLLLGRVADIEAKLEDYTGWTALQMSSYWGHKAIIAILLDHGADSADINVPPRTSYEGETALQLASSNNHGASVRLLHGRGAKC